MVRSLKQLRNKNTRNKHLLHICKQNRSFPPFFPSKTMIRRPEVFFKLGILKNYAEFVGKQMCRSLFCIKLQPSVQLRVSVSAFFLFFILDDFNLTIC